MLIEHLTETFKKETNIELKGDNVALQRLKEAAEKAKIELSSLEETEINLPYITADQTGPKHLVKKITPRHIENLVAHLIDRTKGPCQTALKDANLGKGKILMM